MLYLTLRSFENASDLQKVREKARKTSRTIKTVSDSNMDLLNNLRDANLEVTLRPTEFEIEPLIIECLEEKFLTCDFEAEFIHNISLKHMLNADKEKIKRIINNVLQNAITTIKPGSKVSFQVSIQEKGPFAEFSIKNTGSSCTDEDLKNIFSNKFTTNGDKLNQGFGLRIVEKFVFLHNGRVWASSSVPEDWFTLCFTIPFSNKPSNSPDITLPRSSSELNYFP